MTLSTFTKNKHKTLTKTKTREVVSKGMTSLKLTMDTYHGSSIVNEGIRVILDLFIFYFFYKKISHAQKAQNIIQANKNKKEQHFYAHKNI